MLTLQSRWQFAYAVALVDGCCICQGSIHRVWCRSGSGSDLGRFYRCLWHCLTRKQLLRVFFFHIFIDFPREYFRCIFASIWPGQANHITFIEIGPVLYNDWSRGNKWGIAEELSLTTKVAIIDLDRSICKCRLIRQSIYIFDVKNIDFIWKLLFLRFFTSKGIVCVKSVRICISGMFKCVCDICSGRWE